MISKVLYKFVQSINNYSHILPAHIVNILKEDQASKSPKYQLCKQYLNKIAHLACQNDSKIKANMVFNADCIGQALQNIKPQLCSLIIDGSIKNQYELDQLIKWLTKEVKINRGIDKQLIRYRLSRRKEEEEEFHKQLQGIPLQQCKDLNQICKSLRDKYITIDSKLIYTKVCSIFKNLPHEDHIKKQNKLWDKLMEIKPRRIKQQCNSKEIYDQHLRVTQGKPRFRFPPEPNGYLHIGHVKSIRVNFQSAKRNNGTCYLRYDDTNPEKETHQFIQQIEDNVKWLGYTPDKITFASDYFDQLQHYAHQLIKQGNAYVCDSSQEEIQSERKNKKANPYRQRTIEESLKIFPNLETNQTLRLKWAADSANPTLRDPIMYRLKNKPHPRTGSKYKIYPMYDFTHCISDSIEHIDYSLCSLEFEIRRELYYIFLDLLGLYKPTVWEYSRLNIEGNVLSKRKIKEFIEEGSVDGWDDPRLLTIRGLRNRGYTPQMLKEFIDKVNCSRSGNENVVQFALLQKEMKKVMMKEAVKTMGVLQPIKAKIIDFSQHQQLNQYKLERHIFLQKSDAEGMEINDLIILKTSGVFKVISKGKESVQLLKIQVENVGSFRKANPKVKIVHWIGEGGSRKYKIVTYNRLLNQDNHINSKSRVIYCQARVSTQILDLSKSEQYIQLERIGFFKFTADGSELRLCARL